MKSLIFCTIIVFLFLLTGCVLQGDTKSLRLNTSIRTVHYLNPNIDNQPSPVVLTFYQLKSSDSFKNSSFFELHQKPMETLGTALLDKREIEIRPEQTISFEQNIAPGSTYIGITAAYRNPDMAEWRKIISLPLDNRRINLHINLETLRINAEIN